MENVWQRLEKPIVALAPMEGVSDSAFRQLLVKIGKPDLFFSEFTSVDGLFSRGFDYVKHRLYFTPQEKPIIAQIWGTKPDLFYKAAKLLVEMDYDGIDINMGCPDKAVMKMGSGARLIENQSLVAMIIDATKRGAGNLPVSVKTRIGVKQVVTEEWARFLLEQGISALTIHGRTAAQLSLVPADWREISRAVEVRNQMKSPTIIIGNGDVVSRSQAKLVVRESGVDGVMIGRGVLSNPWVFEKRLRDHTKQEKLQMLLEHVRLYEDTWNGAKPFIHLRKYFKIYAKGFRGAGELREALMKTTERAQVERLISPHLR